MHRGYKRAWHRIIGDSWSNSHWVRRYTCTHGLTHWHARSWESLLPSNITNWVVITRPCASACLWTHHYTPRTAWERRILPKEYRLCRTVMPFGWCLCALFIELLFTSPEAYRRHGDTPYFCMAYVTYLCKMLKRGYCRFHYGCHVFHCRFHYRFHCRFHYGFHCKFHAKSTIFLYWFHDKFHYMYQDFTKINKTSWNPQRFTGFHSNQQDFIMDFTVHSISVKSVIKFIMKSANEIHSEIHNEILLILVKLLNLMMS